MTFSVAFMASWIIYLCLQFPPAGYSYWLFFYITDSNDALKFRTNYNGIDWFIAGFFLLFLSRLAADFKFQGGGPGNNLQAWGASNSWLCWEHSFFFLIDKDADISCGAKSKSHQYWTLTAFNYITIQKAECERQKKKNHALMTSPEKRKRHTCTCRT